MEQGKLFTKRAFSGVLYSSFNWCIPVRKSEDEKKTRQGTGKGFK